MTYRLSRLQTYSMELAAAFRNAPPDLRRAAVVASCKAAVLAAGIDDQKMHAALQVLCGANNASAGLKNDIQVVADEFDKKYFRLLERTHGVFTPDVLMTFYKARAASAVSFALSETAGLEESLYEAIMASQDKKRIEAVARIALELD